MKRKNIQIGADYWIVWIEPDPNNCLNIDDLLDESWLFWLGLETICTSECCSIYAFSFYPKDVKIAMNNYGESKIIHEIDMLRETIAKSPHHSVCSEKLNDVIEKTVFLRLLTHFDHCLKGWVE